MIPGMGREGEGSEGKRAQVHYAHARARGGEGKYGEEGCKFIRLVYGLGEGSGS